MKSFLLVLVLFSISIFASRNPIKGLPLASSAYSGYINVNESADANLFYWFFESTSNPATDPVVLWMTGGPGCSGELAIFFENGPFTVTAESELVPNPYSWNTVANVIYIDQPVGVGFSYASSDYVTGETLVDEDVYTFLQGWFAEFPEFSKNSFFVVGESYGGHYVPSVSATILRNNLNLSNIAINFQGAAIGNGLVSPIDQDLSYGVFGYKYGLINESLYAEVNATYAQCQDELAAGNFTNAENYCESLMPMVLDGRDINYYNIKLECNPAPLCYNFDNITNYLNEPAVQASLHVQGNITWETCNFEVNGHFGIDMQESFALDVAYVLESDYPVFVYSGMLDLICNYIGGDMWTSELKWSGQAGFNATSFVDWKDSNGDVAGHIKSYTPLTFLEVEEAGHMVPHDQPARALELFVQFLSLGNSSMA